VRNGTPPPVPPEQRTIGQLVAEAMRAYGRHPWRSLGLGLSVALLDQVLFDVATTVWLVSMVTGGALLLTGSYVGATLLVSEQRPEPRSLLVGLAAGVLTFLPFPALVLVLILPGLAWLAFVGLAVPAAVLERLPLRAALARGLALGRADYVHALGSLATLAIAFFLTRIALVFVLRGTGDQTQRVAVFLGDLVLSPVLFLGAALLYFDQEARLRQPRTSRG
jgi:hypothetical protein